MALITYIVTLDTPNGIGQLDVPARDADHAVRRARVAAWTTLQWGEPDEITLVSVRAATTADA